MDELVGVDRDPHMCGARPGRLKEQEVTWRELSALDCRACLELVVDAARKRDPYRAKTYWVKPLQSKPRGSPPPFRYGAPRNESAVLASDSPSMYVTGGADTCVVPFDEGAGNGRGTPPPVDAQALANAARNAATRNSRAADGHLHIKAIGTMSC
jgi:hypothetical protein